MARIVHVDARRARIDGLVDGVNVSGEEVSINLLPLIGRGLTALQSTGLLDDVVVPELSADGEPDEQHAALSAAPHRQCGAHRGDDPRGGPAV